jgi:hypothetical protein
MNAKLNKQTLSYNLTLIKKSVAKGNDRQFTLDGVNVWVGRGHNGRSKKFTCEVKKEGASIVWELSTFPSVYTIWTMIGMLTPEMQL